MMTRGTLYEAILARRSVRRYDATPLDEATLTEVRGFATGVRPLVAGSRLEVLLRTATGGQDLVRDLGAYGHLVTPPHYLVPYLAGGAHALTDLGFRMEQIAVRLAARGIGSCFVGCLGRQRTVRARFGLSQGVQIGAFLIFGRPTATLGGRAVNALMRTVVGATTRLPAARIFFSGTFAQPAAPPADLAPLIEAARHAPSARNAQPWRFLWHGGQLHLFVRRHNPAYGGARYNLYDGGLCMGNVTLALEALGVAGRWVPYEEDEPGVPPHPAGLMPLARLALGEQPAGA